MRKPEKPKKLQHNNATESGVFKKYLGARRSSILSLFQALLSDFVNLNPSYRDADSARDLQTITTRLDAEGLGFLSKTLPNLMSCLFRYVETGSSDYAGWQKASPTSEYPAFLGRLFRSVYKGDSNQEVSFSQIYQICVAFKKLRGPYKKSMLRKEMRSFADVDEALGLVSFTSEPVVPIIANARRLIETVLKDFKVGPGDLIPRPGPGATNTPVDISQRFVPHVLYEQLDEEFPYLDYYYSHYWDPVEDARDYLNLPIEPDAESRFKHIEKYLGKPRGICIEENEMMFFQQALKKSLYEHLEHHPATKGRINFTTQLINQKWALTSSSPDGPSMGTLDESEASDRIARELVHRLTWNTNLFHLLDAVSTRRIKMPDGKIIYANKFAPMGSGVCFPVMSLVHWALVRSIISLSSLEDSEKLAKEVYVFGDDLIIPSSCVEAVYAYLPLFGIKINTDKSFYRGLFRESCGVHAYNGVDVTPVYVNYITHNKLEKSDTNTLLSLIAKESLFFEKGLRNTSQCIQNLVRKHYWSLPTIGKGSPILGWYRDERSEITHVTKWASKRRYNTDLQTWELSLQCVVPRKEDQQIMGEGPGYVRRLLIGAREDLTIQEEQFSPFLVGQGRDPFSVSKIPGSVIDLMVRRQWVSAQGI